MNGFVIVGLVAAIVVAAFLWLRVRDRRRAAARAPLDAALPFIAADYVAHRSHGGDAPGGDVGGGGDAGGM